MFLGIREDVWPTIANNQLRIAGLSPELREIPPCSASVWA
jgi:hypothetical protein